MVEQTYYISRLATHGDLIAQEVAGIKTQIQVTEPVFREVIAYLHINTIRVHRRGIEVVGGYAKQSTVRSTLDIGLVRISDNLSLRAFNGNQVGVIHSPIIDSHLQIITGIPYCPKINVVSFFCFQVLVSILSYPNKCRSSFCIAI